MGILTGEQKTFGVKIRQYDGLGFRFWDLGFIHCCTFCKFYIVMKFYYIFHDFQIRCCRDSLVNKKIINVGYVLFF